MRANFVISGVWTGVRRNLTMTIALILSTAIALAFVGAAYLASTEISNFKHDYEGRLNVSVFLCAKNTQSPCHGKTTPAQTAALEAALKADKRIASVSYVSERAQYARAVKIEPPAFAKVARVGDLGASFTVVLKNLPKDFDSFASDYAKHVGVYSVANQVDTLKTLLKIIDGARLFSIMVAIVVLIASILLIANTIQVAAQQRKNETSIMRLVGASRLMTELPFMLETIFATIIGGVISIGLLALGKAFVLNGIFKAPVERKVIPNLNANDLLVAGGIGLIAGIVLAAATAFATLRLYVKV
ncbi:permease-like cell division protein FtsX [uncultured Jatrophihabitans sp.]|uniref:permease-like cell division protein FtsX n=1 Tax=uncultured Jatrophihabitans sp. TaxID=1610747 RepID=UPI0035CAB81F